MAPSSILDHDTLSNPPKVQLKGPGLKIHLYTNSVTYRRQLRKSYRIRVQGLIRGSPKQPWNLQVHSKMDRERVSSKVPSYPAALFNYKSWDFRVLWTRHVSTKQTLYHCNQCDIKCFIHFSTRKYIMVRHTKHYTDKVLNMVTIKAHRILPSLSPRLTLQCQTAKEFSPAREALAHTSHTAACDPVETHSQPSNMLFESCQT